MAATLLDRLYSARRKVTSGASPVEVLAHLDAAIADLTADPEGYDIRADMDRPDPGPMEAPDLARELF